MLLKIKVNPFLYYKNEKINDRFLFHKPENKIIKTISFYSYAGGGRQKPDRLTAHLIRFLRKKASKFAQNSPISAQIYDHTRPMVHLACNPGHHDQIYFPGLFLIDK